MLRFTGTTVEQLIIGFSQDFAAIGNPDDTFIKVAGNKEVWCINRRHDFWQQTFRDPDREDLEIFKAEHCRRLQFLRRKFFEDVDYDNVLPLYDSIRRVGPSPLLWVVKQDDDHRPGEVEQLERGFLKGYIDEFTPHGRAAFGSNVWLTICRNARAR